jgi:hypothetical protein
MDKIGGIIGHIDDETAKMIKRSLTVFLRAV